MTPYLAPPEGSVQKRLSPPISYNIEALPHKIDLDIQYLSGSGQALIGDAFKVGVGIKPQSDILLKSVKAQVLNVSTMPLAEYNKWLEASMGESVMLADGRPPPTPASMRDSVGNFAESMSRSVLMKSDTGD